MLNRALMIEMIKNSFTKSKKNFGRLNVCGMFLLKKLRYWKRKKKCLLNFAKYLSYSEVQKNMNVVNIWNRFKQVGNFFRICYKKAVWKTFGK